MKNKKSNERVTYLTKKQNKVGKFFILFVVLSFFASIILISSALSNFLSIKNWGIFVSSASIPAINIYCVGAGEYETENSALVQSELIKDKGGAGYIFKNGEKFTVLLFGYLNKETALKIIENNSAKLENLVCVPITIEKMQIDHNRTATDISPLTNICNLKLNTFKKMQEISNNLDSGNITTSQAFNNLFNLTYEIEQVIKSFEKTSKIVSSENYDYLLSLAKNILAKVNLLILNTSKQHLSFSIKYVALDVLFVGES